MGRLCFSPASLQPPFRSGSRWVSSTFLFLLLFNFFLDLGRVGAPLLRSSSYRAPIQSPSFLQPFYISGSRWVSSPFLCIFHRSLLLFNLVLNLGQVGSLLLRPSCISNSHFLEYPQSLPPHPVSSMKKKSIFSGQPGNLGEIWVIWGQP